MKSINQVVNKVFVNPSEYAIEPAQSKPLIDPASAQVVNALFAELKAIHPAWRSAWPNVEAENNAKRSWTKAFTSAGMCSIEQIRYGIERCRANGNPFMPSVGEFLNWCRPTPENMGLPSVERAYLQACAASHPAADSGRLHPAVWHAACETGLYLLARQPESKSRPAFERAYALTIEMIIRGEPLREIPKALPSAPTLPRNFEAGNAALANLKKRVGANP